ncbi:MAG: type III pantothenate kinase [Chromatocurvus sp.]
MTVCRDGSVLQIDLGNSALKWRVIRGDVVLERGMQAITADTGWQLQGVSIQPSDVIVASVAAEESEQQLAAQICQRWSLEPWFARSEREALGLSNSYANPGKMGVDRWLAMLAAWHRRRERVCVVDAGSALTIDIVAASGQHEGGYILPGAALMQHVLLHRTQRVRFDEVIAPSLVPGVSTAEAVSHGAALAQCGAIQLALSVASAGGAQRPRLVVSGGGGEAIAALLEEISEFRRDLVFEGLALAAIARAGNIV